MTENKNGKCEMKKRRSFSLALLLVVSLGVLAIVLLGTPTAQADDTGVEINVGGEYAASTAVTLTLQAPFTATQMQLSHDGIAWNDWEDFAATRD